MITITNDIFAFEFEDCIKIDKANIVHSATTFFEYGYENADGILKIGAHPLEGDFERIGIMSDDILDFLCEATDLQKVLKWAEATPPNGNVYVILKRLEHGK